MYLSKTLKSIDVRSIENLHRCKKTISFKVKPYRICWDNKIDLIRKQLYDQNSNRNGGLKKNNTRRRFFPERNFEIRNLKKSLKESSTGWYTVFVPSIADSDEVLQKIQTYSYIKPAELYPYNESSKQFQANKQKPNNVAHSTSASLTINQSTEAHMNVTNDDDSGSNKLSMVKRLSNESKMNSKWAEKHSADLHRCKKTMSFKVKPYRICWDNKIDLIRKQLYDQNSNRNGGLKKNNTRRRFFPERNVEIRNLKQSLKESSTGSYTVFVPSIADSDEVLQKIQTYSYIKPAELYPYNESLKQFQANKQKPNNVAHSTSASLTINQSTEAHTNVTNDDDSGSNKLSMVKRLSNESKMNSKWAEKHSADLHRCKKTMSFKVKPYRICWDNKIDLIRKQLYDQNSNRNGGLKKNNTRRRFFPERNVEIRNLKQSLKESSTGSYTVFVPSIADSDEVLQKIQTYSYIKPAELYPYNESLKQFQANKQKPNNVAHSTSASLTINQSTEAHTNVTNDDDSGSNKLSMVKRLSNESKMNSKWAEKHSADLHRCKKTMSFKVKPYRICWDNKIDLIRKQLYDQNSNRNGGLKKNNTRRRFFPERNVEIRNLKQSLKESSTGSYTVFVPSIADSDEVLQKIQTYSYIKPAELYPYNESLKQFQANKQKPNNVAHSTSASLTINQSTEAHTNVTNDDDSGSNKLSMVKRLSNESKMNSKWAEKCLEENEWDYSKACTSFFYMKDKIPFEAFLCE